MIGISVFMSTFSVDIQAYAGIAVVMTYLAMHLNNKPYNHILLDHMETYALITAFSTLYIGLLFYIMQKDMGDSVVFVIVGSMVIVILNVAFLVFAVWEIAYQYAIKFQGPIRKVVKCCRPLCAPCRGGKRFLHLHTHHVKLLGLGAAKKSNTQVAPSISSSGPNAASVPVPDTASAKRFWEEGEEKHGNQKSSSSSSNNNSSNSSNSSSSVEAAPEEFRAW